MIARDADARVVLARHRTEARLQPLIAVTTAGGKRFVLELSEGDFRNLALSISQWAAADEQQVAMWYEELGNGETGRRLRP
ncbi:hypothetical protein [Mycolicibacterium tokaiense]|uniref:hypothetical protein n=1 Tax=Mycolicibacterium tokaiense TaxID=39695 RepID=UPI0011C07F97|nr:hypothetical protein [Mycolicibacterium tokaiense]